MSFVLTQVATLYKKTPAEAGVFKRKNSFKQYKF